MSSNINLAYNILALIEELRNQDDIIAAIKDVYPASDAFIAHVVRFEQEIQQIPTDKEVLYVKLKGEQELCKVFSVDERCYTIQSSMVDAGRGIHERCVSHEQIAERLYE